MRAMVSCSCGAVNIHVTINLNLDTGDPPPPFTARCTVQNVAGYGSLSASRLLVTICATMMWTAAMWMTPV